MLTQQEVTAERVVFRQGLQNTLVTLTTWGHGPILQVHTHNYTHTHTQTNTHTLYIGCIVTSILLIKNTCTIYLVKCFYPKRRKVKSETCF